MSTYDWPPIEPIAAELLLDGWDPTIGDRKWSEIQMHSEGDVMKVGRKR